MATPTCAKDDVDRNSIAPANNSVRIKRISITSPLADDPSATGKRRFNPRQCARGGPTSSCSAMSSWNRRGTAPQLEKRVSGVRLPAGAAMTTSGHMTIYRYRPGGLIEHQRLLEVGRAHVLTPIT